jgi:hypothetical protein
VTYVVKSKTDPSVDHEVTEVTDSGNYVTKCQKLIMAEMVAEVFTDTAVSCKDCIEPQVEVAVVARPRKPRPPNAKPQWRTARNRHAEMVQGLKFAHKAIVAALEWAERGENLQFIEESLDQSHLGYRFLKEILIDHRRIPDDTIPDTE